MVSNDNETYLGFDLSTQKVGILFKNKHKMIFIKSGVMVGITVFLGIVMALGRSLLCKLLLLHISK